MSSELQDLKDELCRKQNAVDIVLSKIKEIEEEQAKWPKVIYCFIHGDKETNIDMGKLLCLSPGAMDNFAYALCEVEVGLRVDKDGSYKIISINGREVKEQ